MRVQIVVAGGAGELLQAALRHKVRDGQTMTRLLQPTASGAADLVRRLQQADQVVLDVTHVPPRQGRGHLQPAAVPALSAHRRHNHPGRSTTDEY